MLDDRQDFILLSVWEQGTDSAQQMSLNGFGCCVRTEFPEEKKNSNNILKDD
jgi:hypothetical protein